MATFAEFTSCLRIQAVLDAEAIDIALLEPLRDLTRWWEAQSSPTRRYADLLFVALAGQAVTKFLERILGSVTGLVLEALGAILTGVALGLVVAALIHCGIDAVTG